ncbi:CHAT domain-containing protein [Nostoc sp. UHCC 0302]|uniref:CHAT domain-containing protein n=1 Tax=Nostoc sp. UHCC 0302 TaxID=3134896 RepID=UPI00311CC98D
MVKGFGVEKQKNKEQDDKGYIDLLHKLLKATSDSQGKSEVLYRLLRANLDELNDKFAQILCEWATKNLSDKKSEEALIIAFALHEFSYSLSRFPLCNQASHLEIVITGYEAALTVLSRDRIPLMWATAQNNLGNAYRDRIRGERSENQEKAILCWTEVLQEPTRSRFLDYWGNTLINLGAVLCDRILGDRSENLEQAIHCLTEVIKKCTSRNFPEQWATAQYNLGKAYSERIQGDKSDNIEQAINSWQQALQVRTRESFPKDWASIQYNLGGVYLERFPGEKSDNIEQAIECYTKALKIYRCSGLTEKWAKTQYNLGMAYEKRIQGKKSDNIEQAINFYRQALQECTPNRFPEVWARTQHQLGQIYMERIQGEKAENIEQAIHCFQEKLKVRTRDRFPLEWLNTHFDLGIAYERRIRGERAENIEQAIFCCTNTLQECSPSRFPDNWALTQFNLGISYRERIRGKRVENLEKAIHCLTQAQQIFSRERIPKMWANTQNILGVVYWERIRGEKAENIEKAIHCFTEALQFITREDSPQDWAKTQNVLGNAYGDRILENRAENLEQSIHCFQQALQVYTREDFPQEWALVKCNLGITYEDRIIGERAENLELAICCFQESLQVRTRDRFPQEWAQTMHNLGFAYSDRIIGEQAENLELAINCNEELLIVRTRESFPEEWANTQWSFGNYYTKRLRGERAENIKQAIHHYTQALQEFTSSAFPQKCLSVGRSLGNVAFINQIWDKAIFGYAAAIEAVETSRIWATSETRRQKILEEAIDIYQEMVQACINAGQLEKAFEYSERSRSKRLVDLMASYSLYQGEEIPPKVQKLLQQYEELQRQIDQEWTRHQSEKNPIETRAKFQAYNEAIASLETQKQQVWESLRREDPVLAGEIQVNPLSLSEIQKLIDQTNTAILSFYTTNSDTHIFVVKQNQITLHTCTGQGLETLQDWIKQSWLLPYINDSNKWKTQTNSILRELAERLQISELIFQHLQGIEELILVPHLLLHQIPLAALPTGEYQEYLGDKFLIRYTPSCQILEFCQQRDNVETLHTRSLQYGTVEDAQDNLPCASFEGEKIAQLHNIPREKRLIGSSQATCKNYRQLVQQVQVLHSCHHAQSRLDNPLESQLKLADGSITLGQLMTPSWRFPQLFDVFLSCCETNLGNPSLTDDILTLSTGFLCAGARSVVSTLWAVNDLATALFSIFYYQQRQQGKTRPESLQQAQIQLRQVKKEDLTEISQQAELGRKEARNKRQQYLPGSTEYLECDREYRKYAGVTLEISKVKNSPEKFPFSHSRYWAAFICQGLR